MPTRRIVILLLAVFLLVAASVRLYALTRKSLWDDEIFSLNAVGILQLGERTPSWSSIPENVFRYYVNDNHPPLFFLLLGAWLKLFGANEFAIRLFPLVINLVTLPVIYLLGFQIFRNRAVSLVACLVFSLSPYLVYYSQEARMYSLLLLLSCLSMLFFLKIQESAGWQSYAGFVLFSVLGLYTHYYYAFFLCFQVLYWIFFGDRRIYNFLNSLAVIVLFFIPWLPVLLYQVSQKNHSDLWIRGDAHGMTALGEGVGNSLGILFRFITGENFVYPNSSYGIRVIVWLVSAVVAVVLLQRPFWLRQRYGKLLLLWLLLPLAGGLIIDLFFRTRTLEISKYFIMSYPAMLMILAVSSVRFRWKYFTPVLVLGLVLLDAKVLQQYYRTPKAVEWRDVADYLSAEVGDQDIVLSPDPKVSVCVGFYLRRPIRMIEIPYGSDVDYMVKSARRGIQSSQKLWVVSIYEPFTPKLQLLSKRLEDNFPLLSNQIVAEHAVVRSFANPEVQRAQDQPRGKSAATGGS
jgi:4-amino-4-deoxy-L-arabinose transferase-like glycosyltransferase